MSNRKLKNRKPPEDKTMMWAKEASRILNPGMPDLRPWAGLNRHGILTTVHENGWHMCKREDFMRALEAKTKREAEERQAAEAAKKAQSTQLPLSLTEDTTLGVLKAVRDAMVAIRRQQADTNTRVTQLQTEVAQLKTDLAQLKALVQGLTQVNVAAHPGVFSIHNPGGLAFNGTADAHP